MRAFIGIGGNSGMMVRFGNSIPKASSRPKSPPEAPTVGESEPVGPIKHGGVRFYWYQAEGDSQPDFDPRRDKVAIFIHGWHKADKNAQVVIDLQFKTLVSGGKDYGKELQLQGYNVGVIDWFEVARTDKVGDAERGVWNPQFAEDLQLAYRDGMQQISDIADEEGLDPQVRVMGHSLGAQVASALVGKLSGAVVSRKLGRSVELGAQAA